VFLQAEMTSYHSQFDAAKYVYEHARISRRPLRAKRFSEYQRTDQQADAGKFYSVQSGDVLVEGNAVRPSQTGERIIYTPNTI
jgi:hypothetical protein